MTRLTMFLLPIALLAAPLAASAEDWRDDGAYRRYERAPREVFWEGNCRVEQWVSRDGALMQKRKCRDDGDDGRDREPQVQRNPEVRERYVPPPAPVVRNVEQAMLAPRIIAQAKPLAMAPRKIAKPAKALPAPRVVAKAAPAVKPVRVVAKLEPARKKPRPVAVPHIVAKVQAPVKPPRIILVKAEPVKRPKRIVAQAAPVPKPTRVIAKAEPVMDVPHPTPSAEPVVKTPKSDWLVTLSPDEAKAEAVVKAPLVAAKPHAYANAEHDLQAYITSKRSDPYSNLK